MVFPSRRNAASFYKKEYGRQELDALVDTHYPHLVLLHEQGTLEHALCPHASEGRHPHILEGQTGQNLCRKSQRPIRRYSRPEQEQTDLVFVGSPKVEFGRGPRQFSAVLDFGDYGESPVNPQEPGNTHSVHGHLHRFLTASFNIQCSPCSSLLG